MATRKIGMAASSSTLEERNDLFMLQISKMTQGHFLVLYWSAQCEGLGLKYNITNCFDDLKRAGLTRTKQTAVAMVETLSALCYIDMLDDRNRKNLTITTWGARALEQLVISKRYETKDSAFIEENQK